MIHRLFATAGTGSDACAFFKVTHEGSRSMQTTENNIKKRPISPEPHSEKLRDPVKEAVEDALLDQDIPVETGVQPGKTRRNERP
jgi:hypothetical protein